MNLGQLPPNYPNVTGSAAPGMAQQQQPAGGVMTGGFQLGPLQTSSPFNSIPTHHPQNDAVSAAAVPVQPPPMVSLGASSVPREASPGRAVLPNQPLQQQQPNQLQSQQAQQQALQGGAAGASRLEGLAQKLAKARPGSNTNSMPPTHTDATIIPNVPPTDTVAGVNAVGHQLGTPLQQQPQQPLPSPVQPTSAEQPLAADSGRQSRSQNRQQQQQQITQQNQKSPAGGRRRGQQQQQQQQQIVQPIAAPPQQQAPAAAAFTPTANRPRSDPRFKYELGEHVYAMYLGGRWYRCQIKQRDVDPHPENPSIMAPNYLIEYMSNARGMADKTEWVLEECLLPLTDEMRVRELNKWAGQEARQTAVKTSAASSSSSGSSSRQPQQQSQRGRKRPAAGGGGRAAAGGNTAASKKAAVGATGGRGGIAVPVNAAAPVGMMGSGQVIRGGVAAAGGGRGAAVAGGRRGGPVEQQQPMPQQSLNPQQIPLLPQPQQRVIPPSTNTTQTADVEMKDVQGLPPAPAGGANSEPTRPERIGAPAPSANVAGGVVSHQHPGSNAVPPPQQPAGGQFVPNGGNATSASSLPSTTTSGEPPTTTTNIPITNAELGQTATTLPSPPQKLPPVSGGAGETNTTAAAGGVSVGGAQPAPAVAFT